MGSVTVQLPDDMLQAIDERIQGTDGSREDYIFWLLRDGLRERIGRERGEAMLHHLRQREEDGALTPEESSRLQWLAVWKAADIRAAIGTEKLQQGSLMDSLTQPTGGGQP